MAVWMYLERTGSFLCLEVCVEDGGSRGARVQVPGPSTAGPQQQLPSSSQASLKPDLSSLALPLLIALANAYLSPGGSFWLK